MVSELNLRLLPKMSLKIRILFMFGFAIYLRSSAQFCVRRYVNGKWISKGDCGGPGKMSEIQKELQRRIKDEEWFVFQRRINGDVDFYRGWADYKKGFGDSDGNLWLGLEELHERTKEGNMELEINMITKDKGIQWVAKYRSFRIGPGSDKYRLYVSGYSENATGDGLAHHNNLQFSTKDADHDGRSSGRYASWGEGGWWYGDCGSSNLNGNFHKTGVKGIWWHRYNLRAWDVPSNLLRFSEMKIRKRA